MLSVEYHLNLTIFRERREHRVFRQLLLMIPGLEERLMEGSDENIAHTAELVGRFSHWF
jgi:hypothetical protein